MNMHMPLNLRAKNWRERMSLTQEEAADKLGVTSRTVKRWENYQTPVTWRDLLAMAAVEQGLDGA